MALISLHNVTLGFGGHPLLENVSLQIEEGERVSLIGRNGAGKTSLLKLLMGEVHEDHGDIIIPKSSHIDPNGVTVTLARFIPS